MILVSQVSTDIIREVSFKIDRERQLVAIKGLRGVGKMTMIRQSVKQKYGVSVGESLLCNGQ